MKKILLKVILIMSLFYIFGCASIKEALQEHKWTDWRPTYDKNGILNKIQYSTIFDAVLKNSLRV